MSFRISFHISFLIHVNIREELVAVIITDPPEEGRDLLIVGIEGEGSNLFFPFFFI